MAVTRNARRMKRLLYGIGHPIWDGFETQTAEMVLCGLGHPVRYLPLWCECGVKEFIFLLSSSFYGLPWQGVWVAATIIALVRRSGGLYCYMLTLQATVSLPT